MKIRRRRHHSVPSLNMASMPDLIFTVLFFFMIVTHMRTETLHLRVNVPEGQELTKTARQPNVANLYVGTDAAGNTHLQLGERVIALSDLAATIAAMRQALPEEDRAQFLVNIRADRHTSMGYITDLKQELRKVGALTIRYSAQEVNEK